MKTTDLFNKKSHKLNEAIDKVFGQKMNFTKFSTPQLEDARNRLRTQLSQTRNESKFNETVENETYTKAQWMLDAIVAELAERNEVIVDSTENSETPVEDTNVQEGSAHGFNVVKWYNKHGDQLKLTKWLRKEAGLPKDAPVYFDDADLVWEDETIVRDALVDTKLKFNDLLDAVIKASGSKAPAYAHQQGVYRRPGVPPMQEFPGTWKGESIEQGQEMKKVNESAADKAGAVVVAKDMTDKVGRWIEELSGMENDTLLTLGDTIRDEMGQEEAKRYLEAVAPAIQQALQNLRQTRETLASGMRALTGEEQSAEMIGSEPEEGGDDDMAALAEPDAMNAEPAAAPEDDFAAADAASGGDEAAGREQRESINYQGRLLKVLAG